MAKLEKTVEKNKRKLAEFAKKKEEYKQITEEFDLLKLQNSYYSDQRVIYEENKDKYEKKIEELEKINNDFLLKCKVLEGKIQLLEKTNTELLTKESQQKAIDDKVKFNQTLEDQSLDKSNYFSALNSINSNFIPPQNNLENELKNPFEFNILKEKMTKDREIQTDLIGDDENKEKEIVKELRIMNEKLNLELNKIKKEDCKLKNIVMEIKILNKKLSEDCEMLKKVEFFELIYI